MNQFSQIKLEFKYSPEEIIGSLLLSKDNLEKFLNKKSEQEFVLDEDVNASNDELKDSVLLELEVKDNDVPVRQVQFSNSSELKYKGVLSSNS